MKGCIFQMLIEVIDFFCKEGLILFVFYTFLARWNTSTQRYALFACRLLLKPFAYQN